MKIQNCTLLLGTLLLLCSLLSASPSRVEAEPGSSLALFRDIQIDTQFTVLDKAHYPQAWMYEVASQTPGSVLNWLNHPGRSTLYLDLLYEVSQKKDHTLLTKLLDVNSKDLPHLNILPDSLQTLLKEMVDPLGPGFLSDKATAQVWLDYLWNRQQTDPSRFLDKVALELSVFLGDSRKFNQLLQKSTYASYDVSRLLTMAIAGKKDRFAAALLVFKDSIPGLASMDMTPFFKMSVLGNRVKLAQLLRPYVKLESLGAVLDGMFYITDTLNFKEMSNWLTSEAQKLALPMSLENGNVFVHAETSYPRSYGNPGLLDMASLIGPSEATENLLRSVAPLDPAEFEFLAINSMKTHEDVHIQYAERMLKDHASSATSNLEGPVRFRSLNDDIRRAADWGHLRVLKLLSKGNSKIPWHILGRLTGGHSLETGNGLYKQRHAVDYLLTLAKPDDLLELFAAAKAPILYRVASALESAGVEPPLHLLADAWVDSWSPEKKEVFQNTPLFSKMKARWNSGSFAKSISDMIPEKVTKQTYYSVDMQKNILVLSNLIDFGQEMLPEQEYVSFLKQVMKPLKTFQRQFMDIHVTESGTDAQIVGKRLERLNQSLTKSSDILNKVSSSGTGVRVVGRLRNAF